MSILTPATELTNEHRARFFIRLRLGRSNFEIENADAGFFLMAAKRARQINSYYHNLGEGTFDEYPPPMVDTSSKNYLKISLDEIAAGKIKYRYRG